MVFEKKSASFGETEKNGVEGIFAAGSIPRLASVARLLASEAMRRVVLLGVIGGLCLLFPSAAGALQLQIVNQSGRPDSQVFVNVAGVDYDVPGMSNDTPVALSTIPNSTVTINQLVSGRVDISYGQGVPRRCRSTLRRASTGRS